MSVLHVRAALPDQTKPQAFQNPTNLARLEDGWLGHSLRRHGNALSADELGFQLRLAIFKQHLDHFAEIPLKFVE
jgi:hypothetical protein